MDEFLTISTETKLFRFAQSSIVCVEADGNYSTFTLSDGSTHEITIQLGKVEKLMEYQFKQFGVNFIQVGRSLIVNRNYIQSIEPAQKKLVMFCGSNSTGNELFVYKNEDFSDLKSKDIKEKKLSRDYTVKDEKRTIYLSASPNALKELKEELEKNFML